MIGKIRFQFQILILLALIFSYLNGNAQDTILNKYGLFVIQNVKALKSSTAKDPRKQMADIKKSIPRIHLDLRYASSNNFTGTRLYPVIKTTYLREVAASSLSEVEKELRSIGLGLKIFDAYRPYSITEKMWERVKDDRYAADPKKGSNHNRGAAVDLTLVDSTGKELDMGTGFDNFTDSAHHAFTNLDPGILKNRLLLKNIMEKHGFIALTTEWWHYSLPDAKKYELLDLTFKQLRRSN